MDNKFDYQTAGSQELWDYCMREYSSQNAVVKMLLARFYNSIKQALPAVGSAGRVLEVGCGAGESTRRLIKMFNPGIHYEASEFDTRYVEILLRTGFPVSVRQESVYELDRADNSFELIIMLEVLEHLEDYERALTELFRVSSKYVLISVPNEPLWSTLNFMRGRYWKSLGNTPGHINHWSPATLRKLLSRFGSVRRIATPLPWIIALAEK